MKALWVIGGITAVVISLCVIVTAVVAEIDRQEREYWDALCERG